MKCHLPRLAAVLLGGVSLAACSTIGGDSKPAVAASNDSDSLVLADTPNGMPTDLTGEIQRAQTLRAQGDFKDADKALAQLMLFAPDDPRVVSEYGKVLVQQGGRSADAIAFLSRAEQLAPSDWTVYSALGVAYDQAGDAQNAKQAYERALALKPGEPSVLNNYGLSRMAAGDIPAARALLAEAAAAGSNDPKIKSNLAMLDHYGPSTPQQAVPPTAVIASVPARPGSPVAVAALAPPRTLNSNVIMEPVPVDPLAGPVKTAHAHPMRRIAASSAKPKAVAAKKDKAPALRMSADAS